MTAQVRTTRRRRLTAAALALPLTLAMTGTAFGSSTAELRVASAGAEKAGDARRSEAPPVVKQDAAPGPKAELAVAKAESKAEPKAEAAASKAEPAVDKAGPAVAAPAAAATKAKAEPEPAAAAAPAAVKAAPKPERKAEPKAASAPEVRAGSAGVTSGPAKAPSTGSAPHGGSSDKHGTATSGPLTSPQPLSHADKKGNGANPGPTCTHTYCSTRDGVASKNGSGGGTAGGKPCAGCVGRADNKNPPGQAPGGSDRNNGYECDGNNGVGKTNPAHTGCSIPAPAPTRTSVPPVHCPGTTTPAPRGNVRNCPEPPVLCPGTTTPAPGGDVRSCPKPPVLCPGTTTAAPGGEVRDCPKPPKTCPDGASAKGAGVCGTREDPDDDRDRDVTICHATGSATNPYVLLIVREKDLAFHRGHQDVVPAPAGGCPSGPPPVITCPNGMVAPAGDRKDCPTTPPVCPTTVSTGPVMAGCNPPEEQTPPNNGGGTPISGSPGNQPLTRTPPALLGPPTTFPPVLVPGKRQPALLGTVGGPARQAAARPSALPFTGTDAALLVELGALLLLVGGGLLLTARRERTARVR